MIKQTDKKIIILYSSKNLLILAYVHIASLFYFTTKTYVMGTQQPFTLTLFILDTHKPVLWHTVQMHTKS